MLKQLVVVVVFSIAFGYIEAAVVVYLRAIFHPEGFQFPLSGFWTDAPDKKLLLTEVVREVSTLVVILTSCRLFGRDRRQRAAYFLIIFGVWDIFYYVWLKALINWPASIMDWDILFLIPVAWASPTLAPILVSATMLAFGVVILYRECLARPVRAKLIHWCGFSAAALIIVASFCFAGRYTGQADYANYFSWPVFASGEILAVTTFLYCAIGARKSTPTRQVQI